MFRFILCASLLISSATIAAPGFDPLRNAKMQMHGIDMNKNGTAELREYLYISKMLFTRMDANSDHFLSAKELAGYRFRNQQNMTETQKNSIGLKIVQVMDKNRDQKVSIEEYTQPVRDEFSKTDLDHNMKVSLQELAESWKRRVAELKAKLGEQ